MDIPKPLVAFQAKKLYYALSYHSGPNHLQNVLSHLVHKNKLMLKQQKKNKEQLQEQQVEEGKTKVKSSTDYFYNMLKKQSALPVASSPLSVNHPTLNLGAPTPVAQTPIAPIDKTKNYTPIFSVENYQFIDVN